jgi:hypothetical protein
MAGIITTRQIPVNSVSVFQQATAPINWSQITTYNNIALRLVNSGNTIVTSAQPFTTTYSGPLPFGATTLTVSNPGTTQATTISNPQLPPHTHTSPSVAVASGPVSPTPIQSTPTGACYYANGSYTWASCGQTTASAATAGPPTGNPWAGGSHTHTQTFGGPGSIPFSSGTINFSINYIDVILCQRTI